MIRSRTRRRNLHNGLEERLFLGSYSSTTYPVYGRTDICNDSTGRATDHSMQIDHVDLTGTTPLSGTHPLLDFSGNPTWYRKYTDYVSPVIDSSSRSHLSLSMNSVGDDAVTLIARTNPGRPSINIFNFIYELKDLPGMLKDIWEFKLHPTKQLRSPRDLANHQLSVQMGWLPMVSDLRKMLDFSASVDRKVNELQRLYSKGGLKRRLSLGNASATGFTPNLTIASGAGDLVTCKMTQFTTAERWGTIRWTPTTLPRVNLNDSKALRKYARGLSLGDTQGPLGPLRMKTLWDAIPWTWLIDWFTNVGDYMVAYDNSVPCTHSTPCIMTRTTSVLTWNRTDSLKQYYTGGEGVSTFQTLKRDVTSGTLSAHLPFLSGRQLSILGGLAIQRLRR